MKLSELAEKTAASITSGSPDLEITGAAGLDLAAASDISFLANPKYTPQLATTAAGAVFLGENVGFERDGVAVLRSKNPYLSYTKALRLFHPESPVIAGVHATAVVEDSAVVDQSADISANVYIGKNCRIAAGVKLFPNVTIYDGVTIGKNCVLHSGVSVRENVEIGDNCIIHNNSTIGSDGFGYAQNEDRSWLKIPQPGRVVLEDNVEIGANTSIDRASVGETRIGKGSKIDNLVQIGHSCTVGNDTLICAQTGLAGSSVIGDRVILAGQVGIAGHLKVGSDVVITAKSATSHNVPDGAVMSGIPAFENREWLRSVAAFRKLADLVKRVRELEKRSSETK